MLWFSTPTACCTCVPNQHSTIYSIHRMFLTLLKIQSDTLKPSLLSFLLPNLLLSPFLKHKSSCLVFLWSLSSSVRTIWAHPGRLFLSGCIYYHTHLCYTLHDQPSSHYVIFRHFISNISDPSFSFALDSQLTFNTVRTATPSNIPIFTLKTLNEPMILVY